MQAYEDVAGAQGRRIFYRAERFKARELFGRLLPELELDGIRLSLDDLSMSGLAGFTDQAAGESVRVGPELPVRPRTRAKNVHEGRARVCRGGPNSRGSRVAPSLINNHP